MRNTTEGDRVKKGFMFAGGAIILVGIAVAVWFVATGRIEVVVKHPSDAVRVSPRVCDGDIITLYNSSFSTGNQEERQERLAAAVQEIGGRSGAERDPNCVYMRYTHYIEIGDTAKAKSELDILGTLAQKELYVSSEIDNVQSYATAKETLDILNAAESQSDDAEEGGVKGNG